MKNFDKGSGFARGKIKVSPDPKIMSGPEKGETTKAYARGKKKKKVQC